jgi:MinD superfamily P-loop ATPase
MSSRIKKWCGENNISVAGELPFDKDMVEAMVQRKSIIEFNPNINISKKIKVIWNKIINQKM